MLLERYILVSYRWTPHDRRGGAIWMLPRGYESRKRNIKHARVLQERQIVYPDLSICFHEADVHDFIMKERFRKMKLSGESIYQDSLSDVACGGVEKIRRSMGEVLKCRRLR